ncbi:hypothetical protein HY988_07400, partial [Candidatus Micrarchaeota archaeon]|nr:hypothetical protein [Candidatus Micrarchaeota archaeon]
MDQLYEEFNKKWQATSRILFGEEVGELKDYKKWLIGTSRTASGKKSTVSGKNVQFTLPSYSQSAKIASIDEVDYSKRFSPLSINQIKDLDSIVEAVKDRILYVGNTYLGECTNLFESTDVVSSSYLYSSSQVSYSKWIAYSHCLEYCDNLFGCQNIGTSSYSARVSGAGYAIRSFELSSVNTCQDSYYCCQTFNLKNCMFCFGLRNASHCVGNLQLSPEEYSKIKKKLQADMAADLKNKKSLPQLEKMFDGLQPDFSKANVIFRDFLPPKEEQNKQVIEDAFSKTAKVVLGKELDGIRNSINLERSSRLVGLEKYGNWLKEHAREL